MAVVKWTHIIVRLMCVYVFLGCTSPDLLESRCDLSQFDERYSISTPRFEENFFEDKYWTLKVSSCLTSLPSSDSQAILPLLTFDTPSLFFQLEGQSQSDDISIMMQTLTQPTGEPFEESTRLESETEDGSEVGTYTRSRGGELFFVFNFNTWPVDHLELPHLSPTYFLHQIRFKVTKANQNKENLGRECTLIFHPTPLNENTTLDLLNDSDTWIQDAICQLSQLSQKR